MDKIIKLISGEQIRLLERIFSWDGHQEYYKVQRETGLINIIEVNELNKKIQRNIEDKQLTTTEKLELFYNYFQGRPDVYATRWKSKNGVIGFSPHGEGTWINNGGKYKKEIHTYYPYTVQTVNDHIRAEKSDFKMGAGIYPMLENDMTKLIVIDFDKVETLKDVRAVVQVCRKNNIDMLIERSQSGEGIHLWFFFKEEIPASTARYFIQLILRLAMAEMNVASFSSFDRIIPMQDNLPSKGFGNIIALPLRSDKVIENKTVFLNDDLEVVADFWEELSTTSKYSKIDVEAFIEKFKKMLPVQYYKREDSDYDIQLTNQVIVESAGELKIDKNQISRKIVIQLAHLATIHNPEFYKLQNMRAPTWNISQFVTSASEDENYLYLPRGLKSKLERLSTNIKFIDQLNDGHLVDVTFKGKLRDNQQTVVEEIIKKDSGIITAPTGFGKTVVMSNIIARRKISTLIIVHSKVLANQWKKRLDEFLDIKIEPFTEYTPTGRIRKKDKIGELHSSKESLSHNIDIALFQSLGKREDLEEFLRPYGMVVVDEVHHTAAKSFEEVIKKVNARYLYGLTATPDRKDGLTPILFMRFGEMIVEEKETFDENSLLPKYFYPRFTSYSDMNPELNYQQHLNNMVDIEERNQQIILDVLDNIEEGRTCLVLTERVEHTKVLKEMLIGKKIDLPIYILTSEESDSSNNENIEKMHKQKTAFVLIATSLKVGEGFDLLKLESIFFALPFSWKDRTTQYVGRLHRGLDEKDELRVYDYVDISVEMFGRMYQKRMKVYNRLNYQLAEDDKTRELQTQLYTINSYEKALQFDLIKSKKIVIGVVSIRQLSYFKFVELTKQNKEIIILIKSEKLKKHQKLVEQLEKMNIKIIHLAVNPLSFIVCEDKIIWYGSINFGMTNLAEASTLRLSNQEIAKKMLEHYLND